MKNGYRMRYEAPASQWCEALPIGNGRLGAMIYGGAADELLQINEETVWAGKEIDRIGPDAYEALLKTREAIFAGDIAGAQEYGKGMMGDPLNLKSYQPLCDVTVHVERKGIVPQYERGLDLEEGVYRQSFRTRRGQEIEAEAFAALTDDIVVWRRQVANGQSPVDIVCGMRRMSDVRIEAEGNTLCLSGTVEDGGVDFCCMARVFSDGEITARDRELLIRGANRIEIRIAGATSYFGAEPIAKCREYLDAAEGMDYDTLLARHTEAFREKMGRQSFSLGGGEIPQTVPELLRVRDDDPAVRDQLCALNYTYLRYLLLSSSRPGGVPSNLQGIWNDQMHAPWNSDYHPNINMQINYWGAEGYNLPECVEPLIDWLKMTAKAGEKTARDLYHAGGWVLHHISDIYGCTAPMDGPWGIWPFGGVWMLRTLYEHYLYKPDEAFLKESLLPLTEGAVRFILDFLVECPAGIPGEGKLVTCPSHSPENGYLDQNGRTVMLTYAATMDIEFIRDLFMMYENCLRFAGQEGLYLAEVKEAEARLPEVRISPRYGIIQEWIGDYEESAPGHRHISPMFAVYPGVQIDEHTPELMEAARRTLERRLTHNYDGQGWSYGWIACLYARLGDGNRALGILDRMMHETFLPNLMVVAHGWPQVADAQAFGAAILEMLAQSHTDEIRLLPALPDRWADGEIRGLRVRGGHLIDMKWQKGELTAFSITAYSDADLRIRAKNADRLFGGTETDGTVFSLRAEKGRTYSFAV